MATTNEPQSLKALVQSKSTHHHIIGCSGSSIRSSSSSRRFLVALPLPGASKNLDNRSRAAVSWVQLAEGGNTWRKHTAQEKTPASPTVG